MKDRTYKVARNPRYDGSQKELESMVYKLFDKKTRSEVSVNDELAQELNKVVIKNSKEGNCMLGLKVIFWQQI